MIDTPSTGDEIVYLGLGSNLGNRLLNLTIAVDALHGCREIDVLQQSSIVETAPWGGVKQSNFLNCALTLVTVYSPGQLLHWLKKQEEKLGRTPSERWGPRLIDMDILLFGHRVIETDHLVVPHPYLPHRSFALENVLELNNELTHPISNIPLQTLLNNLRNQTDS